MAYGAHQYSTSDDHKGEIADVSIENGYSNSLWNTALFFSEDSLSYRPQISAHLWKRLDGGRWIESGGRRNMSRSYIEKYKRQVA